MKKVWIFVLGVTLMWMSPLEAQLFQPDQGKAQKVQVEKSTRRRTDQFQDRDRDGVNDRVRKRHEKRINRSFLKTLEEFLH